MVDVDGMAYGETNTSEYQTGGAIHFCWKGRHPNDPCQLVAPPPSNVRAVSKSSERHTDVRLLPLLTVDAESTPGVVETSVQQVGKPGSSGRPNHGFPVDLTLNLSIEWERRGKAWEFLLL